MIKTKNGRLILSSECIICGNSKSRFEKKKQEASRILSSVGIRISLSKTPVLGDILF